MQKVTVLFFVTLLLTVLGTTTQAARYTLTTAGAGSAQTVGNWNTGGVGGGGTAATNFTTTGDTFYVAPATNGVVSGAWAFGNSGSASTVTLIVDGSLTINSGNTLTLQQRNGGISRMTVNGTITFSGTANQLVGTIAGSGSAANNTFALSNGATLSTVNANGITGASASINTTNLTATLNTGANYTFNGASAQVTTGMPTTVNNLTINNASGVTRGAATIINGTLTQTSGALANGGFLVTVNGTHIAGSNVVSGTGGYTLGSGASFSTSHVSGVNGNITASGTKTFNTNNNFTFNGGSAQVTGTFMPTSIAALTISNTSGVTLSQNASASGAVTVNSSCTLDASTFTLSAGSYTNNGIIQFGGASNGVAISSGTVQYSLASGGQTIASGTYNNLTLSNSSNTNTAGGNLTVNGTLTTTAGGTFNMGVNSLSVTTVSHSGILQTQNGSATPISSGKTWGGTVQYSSTTGGQTIANGIYNNLTLNNSSNTNTTNGNIAVSGTLTTTTGGTLNMGSSTLSAGSYTNNGTIQFGGASNGVPISSGTIEYTSLTGGQLIESGTYNNLILSNTSGINTAGGNLTVNGTLTTTIGGKLSMGNLVLSANSYIHNGSIQFTGFLNGVAISTGTIEYNGANQIVTSGTYNNLTLSGSAIKTISADTVNGILSLQGTATVSTAPTYGVSSSLEYAGSAAQTTGPELLATMIQPVTINNTNGVNLNAATTLNNSGLAFTNGNLFLGANNLTLSGTTSVFGAAAGKCIVTNGAGGVVQSVALTSVVYPVGPNATTYNPVTLTGTGAHVTDNFTVSVADTNNPSTDNDNIAVKRTWKISEQVATGSDVNIALQWDLANAGSGLDTTIAIVYSYNGAAYAELTSNISVGSPYISTANNVNDFSGQYFTVANQGGFLPVQLTSFNVAAKGNDVIVSWATKTEISNDKFEIQRAEGKTENYKTIASVAGNGTSNVEHNYSYADKVKSGTYSYRLKQVDTDGKVHYSDVRSVSIVPEKISLGQNYPNPFNPNTTIQYELPATQHVVLKVYNVIGEEIATLVNEEKPAGSYAVPFNASQLSSGMYFYKLQTKNFTNVKQMVLIK